MWRIKYKVKGTGEVCVKLKTYGPLKTFKLNFFFSLLNTLSARSSPQAVSLQSRLSKVLFLSNNKTVMFCFQYLQSSEFKMPCLSLTLFYFTVPSPLNDFVYWFGFFSSLSSLLYWPNAKWTLPSQEEKDINVYTMKSDVTAYLERVTRIPVKRCKKYSCFQKI